VRLAKELFRAGDAFGAMQTLASSERPDATWASELERAARFYAKKGRSEAARRAEEAARERAEKKREKARERAEKKREKARERAEKEREKARELTRDAPGARSSLAAAGREAERRPEPKGSVRDPAEVGEAANPAPAEEARERAPPEETRDAMSAPEILSPVTLSLAGLAGAALVAVTALALRQRHAPEPHGEPTIVESVVAPEPTPAKAPQPFGEGPRYEVLERIGAGGMGVVYRARDRRLGREVALKRLSEQLIDHPKAVRYFLREARAVAALSHANIVTLYDVDQDDGVPFLTMELLEGRNLAQIVSARGPLSSADTARLGAQAAAGLACAHRQGIVHRDVKSANLFLTRARVVKVMDFGLAKMAEELRRMGTVLGTPQYMAPEQAMGRGADHRVDLYALGVTLFQLVTATWPFENGDIAHHHQYTPPPDPRGRRPDVVPALAELILACLAKEPEKRPATAEDVAARLRTIGAA
jgi:tRNA A-37 threonylcarbamoyl transferase component Bud32